MSEIKQINTGVAEIIAVKLPEGALEYRALKDRLFVLCDKSSDNWSEYNIHLPPGNWTPLGIDTELTEEQFREVVGSEKVIVQGVYPIVTYNGMETAKEAFASLMQANGCYSVNPYRKPNPIDVLSIGTTKYHIATDQWQQAEANTGTWLILKRLS